MKALSKMISFTLVRDGEDGEDGQNGKDGKPGPIIYPMGEWQSSTIYESTERARPYVEHFGEYYVLQSMKAPIGIPPSKDVAENRGHWMLMDKFNAIYTKILIAEFGKVGEAIFVDEFMFSQHGVDEEGKPSTNYHDFPEYFTPNFMVNLKTGETHQNSAFIKGISVSDFVDIKEKKDTPDGYLDVFKNCNIYAWGDFSLEEEHIILPENFSYTGFTITIYNAGFGTTSISNGVKTFIPYTVTVRTLLGSDAIIMGGREGIQGIEGSTQPDVRSSIQVYPYELVEFTAVPNIYGNFSGGSESPPTKESVHWVVNFKSKNPIYRK